MRTSIRVGAAAIGLAATLGGCGVLGGVTTGGTTETATSGFVGPATVPMDWAPVPIPPNAALAQEARRVCVDSGAAAEAQLRQLIIQDQRAADGALLVWDAGSLVVTCLVSRGPGGALTVSGMGSATSGPPGPALAAGLTAGGPPTVVVGAAGRGTRVQLELSDGTTVTASVGGGRFAAWWPSNATVVRVRSFDNSGGLVESVDLR